VGTEEKVPALWMVFSRNGKTLLRLSSSFACVTVKLVVVWKRETTLAHIVGGVHFEWARSVFLLKYKQKKKKEKPDKTKKELRLSSSFRVNFFSFLLILQ